MTQKSIYGMTIAVVLCLGLGALAMGGHNVKADQCWKRGDDVNGQPSWQNCSSVHNQPMLKQISACCSWSSQGYSCMRFCDDNAFNGHIIQQPVAMVTPDNCFWSFPVQCHNE